MKEKNKEWFRTELNRPGAKGALLFVGALLLLIVAVIAIGALTEPKGASQNNDPSVSAKGTSSKPSKESEGCDPRFVQVELNRSGYEADPRYEKTIRPIINDTSLSKEAKAKKIKEAELKLAGSNAETLAAWVISMGLYDSLDWKTLVNEGKIVNGGCLSDKGVQVWSEYKGAITASTDVTSGLANGTETNSGIENATYVQAETSGINVDRTAVIYTLADGSKWKKLVICGNPLYDNPPQHLPKGKTVNPEPPKPPEPPKLQPKNPSLDPYAQGKAPIGGGYNQDPGPGVYIPPQNMVQPPAAPRVNPPAPAPAPPAQSNPSPGGGSKPIPDPTPPPKAEPEAPKPTDPAGPGAGSCAPGLPC